MSQGVQSSQDEEDEHLRLTTLAAQGADAALRYQELVPDKTDEDRRLISLLQSLHQTVNHPENRPTDLLPLGSIADMLTEALNEAARDKRDKAVSRLLVEIETIVTAVTDMV